MAGSVFLTVLLGIIGALMFNEARESGGVIRNQEDIREIRIARPDFADIVLTQANAVDGFSIEAPCELPANTQRLQPLLDALAPSAHGYAASEVDLQAAGLNTPQATVTLNGTTVDLGGTDLSGERRYLLRDGRVEFAPEWVLSLVNGGLSALAVLEPFTDALTTLSIDMTPVTADDLQQWQAISAQQIVSWPLSDAEAALKTQTLQAESVDDVKTLLLHHYPDFVALHEQNSTCAYLFNASSLPALAPL